MSLLNCFRRASLSPRGLPSRRSGRLFLFTAGLLGMLSAPATQAAEVEVFSPQGTVKGVRQVTARFAAQMVPFGDPREVAPFDLDCPVAGKGRWADGHNWVYDFDADLPAGVRCRFNLKTGLTAVDGKKLAAGERFEFNTGGPAVLNSLPDEGSQIDENQVFILGLDAKTKPESIRRHVSCQVEGMPERLPVRVLEGKERKTILDQRANYLNQYFRVIFVGADDRNGERARSLILGVPDKGTPREQFLKLKDGADSPLAVVQCPRTLPANAKLKLTLGAGLETASGIASSKAQDLSFQVRPAFTARFGCDRLSKNGGCLPILAPYVYFTAPIRVAEAKRIQLSAEGKTWPAQIVKEDEKGGWTQRVAFSKTLPEKTAFKLELPAGLKDDAGRNLVNAARFPMTVRTDEYPPLVKFPARFGIIELNAEPGSPPLLPVTVRNVEAQIAAKSVQVGGLPGQALKVSDEAQVINWLRKLRRVEDFLPPESNKGKSELAGPGTHSVFGAKDARTDFKLPKPEGAKAFEVIGIPLKGPGFHVVELASPRLGKALLNANQPYYVQTAALATNLAVHFKAGRESSLVWVTSLDQGQPVAGAEVAVRDCSGKVLAKGKTGGDGTFKVGKALPEVESLPNCLEEYDRQYYVTARLGNDFSFVLSSWNEGISAWRFHLPQGNRQDSARVHAVFDRNLLKAGETVHMKLFLRRTVGNGFGRVDFTPSDKLVIAHVGSDQRFDTPVTWSSDGSGLAEWAIPADAKQGNYEVSLKSQDKKARLEWTAGSFRVDSFRLPTMKATVSGPKQALVAADQAEVDVQVSYLSGGGAGGAVKVRGQVMRRTLFFPDYEDYTFANGDVKAGKSTRVSEEEYDDDESNEGAAAGKESGLLSTQNVTLDQAGAGRVTLRGLPKSDLPKDLVAEMEYRDANGETRTSAARIPLWPARVIAGIKAEDWVSSGDQLRFKVLALDLNGKPKAGAQVAVDAFQRERYSSRRRLVGGFYAYDHGEETTRIGSLCQGETDKHGLLICEVKAPAQGNLILKASVADGEGRSSTAHIDTWVAGADDWFDTADHDRMDLLPEKKRYEPTDTARFQVRLPFPKAQVLVTVEREGVLESFVRSVSRDNPVIEVPLRGNYAPNVFVSALAVRGRVTGVAPTALIDLGKPAFKMGMAEIKVGWAAHELKVKLAADKPDYRVRQKAQVAIDVRRANGAAPPKGSEVALIAVDEALLELRPNDSWQLLEAMMQRRGIEVDTSTAQMQVVGKRHFGRKALPAGGGGGRQPSRELFDTLLLWQGRVKLDDNGHANATVPLNDSLSRFRIVAVANGGTDFFGTGDTSIRSTQDVMLLSGLPPVVREQDQFRAGFTVRNASQREQSIKVSARLSAMAGSQNQPLPDLRSQSLSLAPGEAGEIAWDVSVPLDADGLKWELSAGAGQSSDKLTVTQKVLPAVPVRTLQASLSQLTRPMDLTVQLPAGALPGRGGVRVAMQARLADELAGVREYMERYPYSCLEQQASQAVALKDDKRWTAVMNRLPAYLDRDGLAKYFPSMDEGSDSLSAYLLSLAAESGRSLPEAAQSRLKKGLIAFVEGRLVRRSELATADLTLRKLAAIEALSRLGPIDKRWLDSITLEPNLWPTSALLDWLQILKRTPDLPKAAQYLKEAQTIVRSRLNFQGSIMTFSTERSDALWWLMISGDVNANRAILALLDQTEWQADLPRLVRGSLARQQRGRWNTTVANAWGVLAMDRFSDRFEKIPVSGRTSASLGGSQTSTDWSKPGPAATLPWPAQAARLQVSHAGSGAPWITVQSRAALPLKEPLFTGYKVSRSVVPVEQKSAGSWHKGDVLRVRLELDAQSDMGWVVVHDPIPAGAAILGSGLGGDSELLTLGEKTDWRANAWPAFQERTFDSFRAYYRMVPKGKFSVEYTLRLNNDGNFQLPPTRVEAMYAPEMFGELPNANMTVAP